MPPDSLNTLMADVPSTRAIAAQLGFLMAATLFCFFLVGPRRRMWAFAGATCAALMLATMLHAHLRLNAAYDTLRAAIAAPAPSSSTPAPEASL